MGLSGGAGYSCISGSLTCALGCERTFRAKITGFDMNSDVMYSFSVWHSAHVALGIGSFCSTGGISCGFAREFSGLYQGSGILKPLT